MRRGEHYASHVHDYYTWDAIPEHEVERLAKRLSSHLREMGIRWTKSERLAFTKQKLSEQKGTCCFAGGDDKYCWNEPKDKMLSYLKLQWSHKVPVCIEYPVDPNDLFLLCARCNNNLMKSRTVDQLIPELEHKVKIIKRYART